MPNPSKISLLDNWILTVEIRLHGGEIFANEVDLGQLLQTPKKHEIICDEVDKRPSPIITHLRNLNCDKPDLITFEVCFKNPNSMDHPNGNWDLGVDGNVLLESCDLKLTPKDK